MAKNGAHWVITPSAGFGGNVSRLKNARPACSALASARAADGEARMKANAPWNDQSGYARGALYGRSEGTRIELGTTNDEYGGHLENGTSRMAPRPIILPTAQELAPEYFTDAANIIRGLMGGALMFDAIADALRSDPVIAAVATGGVYTRDIRRAGPESAPDAFGAVGERKPSLCLGDGGSVRDAFGGPVTSDVVHVIAIASPSDAGRDAVRTLLDRATWLLDRWQLPTGAMGFYAGRLGRQEDEFGAWDRVLIRFAGIPATRWRVEA